MPFEIRVPDLGGARDVDVLEVLVRVGDAVAVDQGLIVLSSDKASMDIPSPRAGTVLSIEKKAGDKANAGDLIARLELAAGAPDAPDAASAPASAPAPASASAGPPDEAGAPGPFAARRSSRPEGDVSVDLAVLGGGPGGYTAAFRAADLGMKVALIERYSTLGGVCLNVGCIPSKALLHAARVIEEARHLSRHGVVFDGPRIELDKLRAYKDGVVGRLTSGLSGLAARRSVEVVEGVGRFVSDRLFRVEPRPGGAAGGARTVAFDQAIVAAGSRVVEIPGIPYGDPRVIDSTGALALEEIPGRLLVVGGGIIGLEMATVYAALGARVTVVELTPGLVPGCDRDLVRPLERRLRQDLGVEILVDTKVAGVEARPDALEARLEGKKAPAGPVVFDRVLVAVGRRPNGDRIGAEAAGLAVDGRGFLAVDRFQRTAVPHLFAIGDIVGQPMLAHKASHEGRVAAEVAAGLPSAFDARFIPSVAYTDPEIAWVGLTETEAEARGIAYEKGSFPWAASGRSLGMGREDGSTKLLFDPETHRLLGGGVVGISAGDLVAEIGLALEMGAEAADLAMTVHAHPTLSETIAFAAEAFEGTLTDLYLPKRPRKPRR